MAPLAAYTEESETSASGRADPLRLCGLIGVRAHRLWRARSTSSFRDYPERPASYRNVKRDRRE